MAPRSRNTRPPRPSDIALGEFLVAAQGALSVCVFVGAFVTGIGPRLPRSLPGGLVLVVAGAAGLLAAGRHLGHALTSNPVPNRAGLVAHGVYRWVRHPIYASLLLALLGVAVSAGRVLSYVAVAVLVVFFELKSRWEERMLVATYPGYAEYAARTGKFLPGIARLRPSTPGRHSTME